MRVKSDNRSKFSDLSNWKEEAWKKNQGFNGIRTRDLRNTVAMYSFSFSPRRRFVFQTELSDKYIVLVLISRLFYFLSYLRRGDQSTVFCIVSFDFNWSRSPFLKGSGNLTGPKSYFKMLFSRKVGCVLASNEKTFETNILNGKQNSLTGPVITGSFEKRAPDW